MLRILLVRHGQCDMNLEVDKYIGGRTNHSPLTPLGVAQARALGAHLRAGFEQAGVAPQRCAFFSSTAVRAADTAALVMEALAVPAGALTRSEQLLELDQGEWQGQVRAQCYTPELTSAFAADPWGLGWHFQPPGGESQHDVEQRMTAYILGEVLPRVTPDAPGVVVGHGMAIKCFLRGLLQSLPTMSRNISTANTSVTEVGFLPRKARSSSNGGGGSSGDGIMIDSSRGPAERPGGNGGSSNGGSSLLDGWVPYVLRVNDTAHLAGLAVEKH